jgi:hypothetical protein
VFILPIALIIFYLAFVLQRQQLGNALSYLVLFAVVATPLVFILRSDALGFKFKDLLPMDSNNLGFLLWIPILYGLYHFFVVRPRREREFEASTEHPFKVKVAVVPSDYKNATLDFVRGRRLTHFLEVDVNISPKDWKRIKDAGVYDAVLFSFPNERSTYDNTMDTVHVRQLQKPFSIGFYNLIDAEDAKETLLKKLYDLKDTITVQQEGRREESFEI